MRWGAEHSREIPVSNGVKQGGIISPVLFTNYLDELLLALRRSGIGCFVGHTFCGAFGYADDVALLAPCMTALRKMLELCDQFADNYLLKFNPDKSKYLVFARKKGGQARELVWRDRTLTVSVSEIHLGSSVRSDGRGSDAKALVERAVSRFYSRFNVVYNNFHVI